MSTFIKPYYQDDCCTIFHGDCRDILPHLGIIDLLITDPPYGIKYRSNYRLDKWRHIEGDEYLPVDILNDCLEMASSAAYIFCRWDQLGQMPLPKSVLCWVKNNWSMGDLEHEHGRQWEAICFYPRSRHKFIKRIPDVVQRCRTGNNLHPTEKPVDLITSLISCNEGECILDPYMGSGTTLRAAKDLGKKAIGIEIEEKYCEIAVKRLSQGVLDLGQ